MYSAPATTRPRRSHVHILLCTAVHRMLAASCVKASLRSDVLRGTTELHAVLSVSYKRDVAMTTPETRMQVCLSAVTLLHLLCFARFLSADLTVT